MINKKIDKTYIKNFNTTGKASGQIIIPKVFLNILKIDIERDQIKIKLEDNKITIEKYVE